MENDIKIICPLCQSRDISFFCQKNTFDFYRCKDCKLLFVSPLPNSTHVYDETYFSGAEKGFGYVDYDADKEPMIPVFEKYLDIIKENGVSLGKVLDVGCATGFFMNIAKKRGYEVFGDEISDFAAQKGRDKGLNITTGKLEEAKFPDNYFDIVTMLDVLEHVYDPKGFINEAKRILKKDGLLVINTPDAESLWAKIFGKNWHLILPPEHVHYFSPYTLKYYMPKKGFKVLLDTKIGKSFTFQYIFKMLYKWQKFKIWNTMSDIFSKNSLSAWSIPINLHDNLFMILKKENND